VLRVLSRRLSTGTPACWKAWTTCSALYRAKGGVATGAGGRRLPRALVDPARQADAEGVVQHLLAPFIAELGEVREELGRVKAERDAGERAMAELRERAEAAESRIVGLEHRGRDLAGERDEERPRGDTAEQEGEDLRQRANTLQERQRAPVRGRL
jgi:hypothetical protein